MKFEERENQLILRDKSGLKLMFGIFAVFIGTFVIASALGGFEDFDNFLKYTFIMVAVAVGFGILYVVSNSVSELIVDPQTKTVCHKRRGLFKESDKIYQFNDVAGFFVKQDEDEDNRLIWRVELNLTSGEAVEITSVWSRNEANVRSAADAANNFLRK